MPASAPELWWAFVVGTVVFLMLGLGIIANLVFSQRRFIAAQKEQMAALLKSEEEYRDLFNNVTDVVYIHCLNGKIMRINPVFTKFIGYEEKDVLGQTLYEIVDSQYHKKITDYLEEIIENGTSSGLLHLSDKDGKDCIFEYRSSLVKKRRGAGGSKRRCQECY